MKIRDASQLLAMLEGGDLSADLSDEIRKILDALRDASGPKTKAKASLTLKINFAVEGFNTEIDSEITSKFPKAKRARSFFFIGEDGLSTEHPKQINMFPQGADERRA